MLRALVLLCALAWLSEVHAESPRKPALNWVRTPGAEQCIDPRTLAARVQALTGPVLVAPSDAEVSIEAQVSPRPSGGFRVRFTVTDSQGAVQGERVHEQSDADCRALDDAIAFILATTIDPELALPDDVAAVFAQETPPEATLLSELEQTPPEPVVLQPTSPQPPTSSAPAPLPPAMTSPRRTELALAFQAVWGVSPELAPGVALTVQHAMGRVLWLAAGLRAFPPFREAPLYENRRLRTQSYGLSLGPCAGWDWGRIDARGCLGPEVSLFVGSGTGFDRDDTALSWQGNVLGSAQVQLRLSRRWRIRFEGLLAVSWRRARFSYTSFQADESTAFFAPAVGGGASLGASVAF